MRGGDPGVWSSTLLLSDTEHLFQMMFQEQPLGKSAINPVTSDLQKSFV